MIFWCRRFASLGPTISHTYMYVMYQCWSSDGYHLWMLPMPSGEKAGHVPHTPGDQRPSGEGGRQHVLVMEFMRNSIVSNPVVVSIGEGSH